MFFALPCATKRDNGAHFYEEVRFLGWFHFVIFSLYCSGRHLFSDVSETLQVACALPYGCSWLLSSKSCSSPRCETEQKQEDAKKLLYYSSMKWPWSPWYRWFLLFVSFLGSPTLFCMFFSQVCENHPEWDVWNQKWCVLTLTHSAVLFSSPKTTTSPRRKFQIIN